MKSEPTQVLSASETTLYLRVKIGPLRAWGDFLADCLRGRASINGERLMPCARVSDGRAYRPVYAMDDIESFIAHVLVSVTGAGPQKIVPRVLNIVRGVGWRFQKFARDGSRIMSTSKAIPV